MSVAEGLDWWALELAFGHIAPGHHAFLDRETLEVVNVQEEQPGGRAALEQIVAGGARFVRIEPVASRDQHRWMVRYIALVEDPALRERLTAAVVQPGAFRMFKGVLLAVPEARDRWFAFRKQMLRVHIEQWLAERDLAVTTDAAAAAAAGLRREAHELVDGLPAIELPNAIAYLMQLGCRYAPKGRP